jgi:single-strand DNA-binding protein
VVVHGKLSAHVWTNKAGLEVTTFEVEAAFVGHDLNRGTSQFRRRRLAAAGDAVAASQGAASPDDTAVPVEEPPAEAA